MPPVNSCEDTPPVGCEDGSGVGSCEETSTACVASYRITRIELFLILHCQYMHLHALLIAYHKQKYCELAAFTLTTTLVLGPCTFGSMQIPFDCLAGNACLRRSFAICFL